jgi:predicted RNase H-like nuclease (RuvC/YqgF family)
LVSKQKESISRYLKQIREYQQSVLNHKDELKKLQSTNRRIDADRYQLKRQLDAFSMTKNQLSDR